VKEASVSSFLSLNDSARPKKTNMKNSNPKMTVSPFNHVPAPQAKADNPAFELFARSQSLARAGKFAEAASAMQSAINLASAVTAVQNPLRAYLPHFWAEKGRYKLRAGEYTNAMRALQEAIEALERHTSSESHEDSVYMYELMGKACQKQAKHVRNSKQ
jgi:tetratricopeptide (TPR) repeat protein